MAKPPLEPRHNSVRVRRVGCLKARLEKFGGEARKSQARELLAGSEETQKDQGGRGRQLTEQAHGGEEEDWSQD